MEMLDMLLRDNFDINDILATIDDLKKLDPGTSKTSGTGQAADAFTYTEEELMQKGFMESQIQEIMLGMKQQLPIDIFAKECYNWQQMQQIRMGLLENIDISLYSNPLYSADQMREIRWGLIDHLDVSSYAKLLYTATDMSKMRRKLLGEIYQVNPNSFAKEIVDEESNIRIRINQNCMEAYINIPKFDDYSAHELRRILMRNGIVCGISMDTLEQIVSERSTGKEILVAKGTPAKKGRNGRYEYFFNLMLPESPKVLPNGNVDYTNIIVADKVKTGDILAKYHPGSTGTSGETVTGIFLEGVAGVELPPLDGKGIERDVEKNIYTATLEGYVFLDEVQYTLNVWKIYVVNGDVNRYNGNITYDGTIHIKGSVSDMAVISASGDVIVDGFIEGAKITAGGNVVLKKGINAGGNGYINAGGKVLGNFFEYAKIEARRNVEGNYFLDCDISTDSILIAKGNKARIMSGHIRAGKSVESVTIGNLGKTQTIIDVGNVSWIDTRMSRYRKEHIKVDKELLRLNEGKDKLSHLLGDDIVKNNEVFQKICLAIQVKEKQQATLERELQYYESLKQNAIKAYVKVSGRLQEGVMIIINGNRREVEKDLSGVTLKASAKK